MLVASAEEDVAVDVEFVVLLPLGEVVCGRPERTIWEFDVVVAVPEVFAAIVVYPYNVVDPTVIVRVVVPVVSMETTGSVLMGIEGIVSVEL